MVTGFWGLRFPSSPVNAVTTPSAVYAVVMEWSMTEFIEAEYAVRYGSGKEGR
jgi:hypothetical protein